MVSQLLHSCYQSSCSVVLYRHQLWSTSSSSTFVLQASPRQLRTAELVLPFGLRYHHKGRLSSTAITSSYDKSRLSTQSSVFPGTTISSVSLFSSKYPTVLTAPIVFQRELRQQGWRQRRFDLQQKRWQAFSWKKPVRKPVRKPPGQVPQPRQQQQPQEKGSSGATAAPRGRSHIKRHVKKVPRSRWWRPRWWPRRDMFPYPQTWTDAVLPSASKDIGGVYGAQKTANDFLCECEAGPFFFLFTRAGVSTCPPFDFLPLKLFPV